MDNNYIEAAEHLAPDSGQENIEISREIDSVDILSPLSGRQLRSAVEAILLIVDLPVSNADIASALMVDSTQIQGTLVEWQQELENQGSGMQLRYGEGGWRLFTHPNYSAYIERFIHKGHRTKLSRAAIETLAVIAYRQPVTRQEVASVRGVNVDNIMKALETRGLIVESTDNANTVGKKTYCTTAEFLERLGLDDIAQLPTLVDFLPEKHHLEDIAQSMGN